MTSFTTINSSPLKLTSDSFVSSPLRSKRPSPEKASLQFTTVYSPKKRVASAQEAGSPSKKVKETVAEQPITIEDEKDLQKSLAQSKRIELAYSLVDDGRATTPPEGDFSNLFNLFSMSTNIEVSPPFLVVTVPQLPARPWPLTVGGLPVRYRTDDQREAFKKGRLGQGPSCLNEYNLQKDDRFGDKILEDAITHFSEQNFNMTEIYWFGGFWQLTINDETLKKHLPARIGGSPALYRTISEAPQPDPAALRKKPPQGVEYDDTSYTTEPNAILRPGIMLSSSRNPANGSWTTTTSGILVKDSLGNLFITVATHGFEADGLIFESNPLTGSVIGKIVSSIPNSDISLARLQPGLRYVNETFGTRDESDGIRISEIAPPYPPQSRIYDSLTMNNPFSGSADGVLLGLGKRVEDGGRNNILHEWAYFENGDHPIDGSYGSPVLDDQGRVVGLFRWQAADSEMCYCVSAMTLQDHGYELCDGEQTFS